VIITRLKLSNWRNFTEVDVPLRDRAFIIGPNASGKSNLLDALRFLRDVAKREGGGLQAAVRQRGGVRQLRSLSAHSASGVSIEAHLGLDADGPVEWMYRLVFTVERSGNHRILVQEEVVEHNGETLLRRPDQQDDEDSELLTATALEQTNVNRPFRAVAEFFDEVTYLHLVPQMVRYGAEIGGNRLESDPFGQGFLERIAATNSNTRKSRLSKIAASLSHIVPQLKEITFERDLTSGQPHLKARFDNWRAHGVWQREDQFSDGTLRLIGLFWSLLERGGLLLLEEPEISLNRDIVLRLAGLIYGLSVPSRRRRGEERHSERRQVILTTHSSDLLCDQGIDGWEVLCIAPGNDGSVVKPMAGDSQMRTLLEAGVMPGEIAPFRNQSYQLPMDLGLTV
jgi:predicted ATPase